MGRFATFLFWCLAAVTDAATGSGSFHACASGLELGCVDTKHNNKLTAQASTFNIKVWDYANLKGDYESSGYLYEVPDPVAEIAKGSASSPVYSSWVSLNGNLTRFRVRSMDTTALISLDHLNWPMEGSIFRVEMNKDPMLQHLISMVALNSSVPVAVLSYEESSAMMCKNSYHLRLVGAKSVGRLGACGGGCHTGVSIYGCYCMELTITAEGGGFEVIKTEAPFHSPMNIPCVATSRSGGGKAAPIYTDVEAMMVKSDDTKFTDQARKLFTQLMAYHFPFGYALFLTFGMMSTQVTTHKTMNGLVTLMVGGSLYAAIGWYYYDNLSRDTVYYFIYAMQLAAVLQVRPDRWNCFFIGWAQLAFYLISIIWTHWSVQAFGLIVYGIVAVSVIIFNHNSRSSSSDGPLTIIAFISATVMLLAVQMPTYVASDAEWIPPLFHFLSMVWKVPQVPEGKTYYFMFQGVTEKAQKMVKVSLFYMMDERVFQPDFELPPLAMVACLVLILLCYFVPFKIIYSLMTRNKNFTSGYDRYAWPAQQMILIGNCLHSSYHLLYNATNTLHCLKYMVIHTVCYFALFAYAWDYLFFMVLLGLLVWMGVTRDRPSFVSMQTTSPNDQMIDVGAAGEVVEPSEPDAYQSIDTGFIKAQYVGDTHLPDEGRKLSHLLRYRDDCWEKQSVKSITSVPEFDSHHTIAVYSRQNEPVPSSLSRSGFDPGEKAYTLKDGQLIAHSVTDYDKESCYMKLADGEGHKEGTWVFQRGKGNNIILVGLCTGNDGSAVLLPEKAFQPLPTKKNDRNTDSAHRMFKVFLSSDPPKEDLARMKRFAKKQNSFPFVLKALNGGGSKYHKQFMKVRSMRDRAPEKQKMLKRYSDFYSKNDPMNEEDLPKKQTTNTGSGDKKLDNMKQENKNLKEAIKRNKKRMKELESKLALKQNAVDEESPDDSVSDDA